MNTSKFLRRYQSQIIWGGLILGSLAMAHNDIKANLQNMTSVKQDIAENNQKVQKLESTVEFEKQQAEIAGARYEKGCLILTNSNGRFINLQQGQIVVDPTRKTPLPKYTVVCDANGNTGILLPRDFDGDGIKTTVVTETAFTGDTAVIEKALKTARSKSSYANPIQ
jgi:hypothetical protein